MPTKTKDDIKRDILSELEKRVEDGEYLQISRSSIREEFTDEHHSSEYIDNLIDELLEEEPIEESNLQVNIIYPEARSDILRERFNIGSSTSILGIFIIGYYAFVIGVLSSDGLNDIFGGATNEEIVASSLIGIIASYGIGRFGLWVSEVLEDKIPPIQKYKNIIYPTAVILFAGGLLLWGYSTVASVDIPSVAVATLIPGSVIAGVEIGKYIESESGEELS